MTDTAILSELGGRLARHRLGRNLTQAALAREAGVSKRTIARMEAGESTQLTNLIRVVRALGLLELLDALVPEPTSSPIDRVRTRGKERRRASPRADQPEPRGPWSWGQAGDRRGDDDRGGDE